MSKMQRADGAGIRARQYCRRFACQSLVKGCSPEVLLDGNEAARRRADAYWYIPLLLLWLPRGLRGSQVCRPLKAQDLLALSSASWFALPSHLVADHNRLRDFAFR